MSSAPGKVRLPAILIANDLLDGDVVVRTADGWSRDPAQAAVASDPKAASILEAQAREALARNEVVDAYLIDVTLRADGVPIPNHFRERFKVNGPSIRPDLGKQAAYGRI